MDCADALDPNAKPTPGDVTVCLYCSHICAFDDYLKLRSLTGEEKQDVAGDPDVIAAVNAVARLRYVMRRAR